MKYLYILIIFLYLGLNHASAKDKYAQINVECNYGSLSRFSFFKAIDGTYSIITNANLVDNNNVGATFALEHPEVITFGNKVLKYDMYVKLGEVINISVDKKTGIVFKGKISKENTLLQQWQHMLQPVKSLMAGTSAATYVEFFPEVEKLHADAQLFKEGINSGNIAFDEFLKEKVDADIQYHAVTFLFTMRNVHAQKEDYTDYYVNLASQPFVVHANWKKIGCTLVNFDRFQGFRAKYDDQIRRMEPLMRLQYANELINDGELLGAFLISQLSKFKTRKDFDVATSLIKKEKLSEKQQQLIKEYNFSEDKEKQVYQAHPFILKNKQQENINSEDFKGHVMLLDFWATWCGPCKAEIPHLESMAEKFKDEKFTIVSISCDKERNKWEYFLHDEQLKGIHVYNGGFDGIAKDYSVRAIPRFVLIDKEGMVVDDDAPKPSDPELSKMIEELLTK